MRIHEKGDPSRPPLVLLHGLASSPRCWERNVPALEARHHVLLVDLFAGASRPFSLAGVADELATELRRRHHGPVDLVAHSMGGLVAIHVAATAPELLSRMVLLDVPALRHRRRRLTQVGAVARSSMRRQGTGVGLIMGCMLRTSPLLLLAATRATLRADLQHESALATIPTLLVWGADDRIVPIEIGQRLAASMPAAQLVVIPRAGHQPMWEAPGAFNATLAAFLRVPFASRADAEPLVDHALRGIQALPIAADGGHERLAV